MWLHISAALILIFSNSKVVEAEPSLSELFQNFGQWLLELNSESENNWYTNIPPSNEADKTKLDTSYEEDAVTSFSTPAECDRKCVVGENKVCYYSWTVEYYPTVGGACNICNTTETNVAGTSDCQCVLADGYEKIFIAVNRMLPGPAIKVCLNDTVVIDVHNKLEGSETAIHWHGVLQEGTPYYDGVPFVTQCPINQRNTFRYQWKAAIAGTNFWHSHSGLQRVDGMIGSLIIREPTTTDRMGAYYDEDKHIILINDWMHYLSTERYPGLLYRDDDQVPNNILINGRGNFVVNETFTTPTPREVFTVEYGKAYRFRLINAFGSVCPAELSIEGHNMTVMAADGFEVKPVSVSTIVSFSGERYDFIVIATNTNADAFWIQVRGLGECAEDGIQQLAILAYNNSSNVPMTPAPTYNNSLPQTLVLNPFKNATCLDYDPNTLCVSQLRNFDEKVDPGILAPKTDFKFYLPFRFYIYPNESQLFQPNTYKDYLVNGGAYATSLINDVHFTFPPSPLLSQYGDIDPNTICVYNDVAKADPYTTCTHLLKVDLHSTVEIILIDQVSIAALMHPFHLHGYKFYVVAQGRADDFNVTLMDLKTVMDMDAAGRLVRRLKDGDIPAEKDTLPVPTNGFAIVRFRANNPGFWLLHCHFDYHLSMGMAIVLQVGETSDHPPVPNGFPTCGDFKSKVKTVPAA